MNERERTRKRGQELETGNKGQKGGDLSLSLSHTHTHTHTQNGYEYVTKYLSHQGCFKDAIPIYYHLLAPLIQRFIAIVNL